MGYVFLKLGVTVLAFMIFCPIVVGIVESGGSAIWSLLLGIPFVIGLCYFYRYADKVEREECKNAKKSHAAAVETPESSYPGPYCISRYIWTHVFLFAKQYGSNFSIEELTYLWTFFFYIVLKEFRDQVFIDDIYSYFIAPLLRDKAKHPLRIDAVSKIRAAYRKLRIILNGSMINPCTITGMDALWHFVTQWVFSNRVCPDDAKLYFTGSARMILKYCHKYYDNNRSAAALPTTKQRYSFDGSAVLSLPDDC